MAAMVMLGGEPSRVVPPPGLLNMGSTSVIWDALHARLAGAQMVSSLRALMHVSPTCLEMPILNAGEWSRTVLEMVPYLNIHQTREALTILDQAALNCKALERLDEEVKKGPGGGDMATSNLVSSATICRLQVIESQWNLLAQLRRLQAEAMASSAKAALGVPDAAKEAVRRSCSLTEPVCLPKLGLARLPPVGEHSPQEAHGTRKAHTLSSSLQILSQEDPACLCIVRRINKLGFKAPQKLKLFFSQFGPVVRVLLAHSTVRQQGESTTPARRRPASLGFLQMRKASSIAEVLARGPILQVEGVDVMVQQFVRGMNVNNEDEDANQHLDAEEAEEEELDPIEAEKWQRATSGMEKMLQRRDSEWLRQQSSLSGVSTAASTKSPSVDSEQAPSPV